MSDENIEFWRSVSDKYDNAVDVILGENLRPYVLNSLVEEFDLGKTVELGGGTGYFSRTLAEKSDMLTVTDISDEMLEIAKEHLKKIENIEFNRVDCQFTPFKDETFDTAYMGLVLLFTDEAGKALKEVSRILKPNGTLIIAEPDISNLSGFGKLKFLYLTIKYYRRIPTASQFFNRSDLEILLENNGFEIGSHKHFKDQSNSSNLCANYIKSKAP